MFWSWMKAGNRKIGMDVVWEISNPIFGRARLCFGGALALQLIVGSSQKATDKPAKQPKTVKLGGGHPVFVSPFGGNAKTDNLHKLTRTYFNLQKLRRVFY